MVLQLHLKRVSIVCLSSKAFNMHFLNNQEQYQHVLILFPIFSEGTWNPESAADGDTGEGDCNLSEAPG